MKTKKKLKSGSIRIEPSVLEKVVKHCKENGILVSFFANEAVKEKLEKLHTK